MRYVLLFDVRDRGALTVSTEPNAGCYDYLGLNMPFSVVQGNIYCMKLRS